MINRDVKDLRTSRMIRNNIYDATAKSWVRQPSGRDDLSQIIAFIAGALFATVVILFTLGMTA